MAFLLNVYRHGNPDIIGIRAGKTNDFFNYNVENNFSIEGFFLHKEGDKEYLYKTGSILIVTGREVSDNIHYYQLLTPVDYIDIEEVPKIYLKGYLMTNNVDAILTKGINWDGKPTPDFYLPMFPKALSDKIAIDGKCYLCKKITISLDNNILNLEETNETINDWKDRYLI